MKINPLTILFPLIAAAISGCGGGGEPEERAKAAPLRSFSDGSGIGRIDSTLFYTPDLSASIRSFNESDGQNSDVIIPDARDMPIVSVHQYSILRRGVVANSGESRNIAVLQDNRTQSVVAAYLEVPGQSDIILVGGKSPNSIPSSDSYRYAGTQTANARSALAPDQIGNFLLEINFSDRTFAFAGQTQGFTATAYGTIDGETGLFASDNATITTDGRQYSGHLYGQLNGDFAIGAAGIIVSADHQPDYSGSFIGQR